MATIKLRINDQEVLADEGTTVLQAASRAGIYIPALCSHPSILEKQVPPVDMVFQGSRKIQNDHTRAEDYHAACNLCRVVIEGHESSVRSCETLVAPGLRVFTETESVKAERKEHLTEILKRHPNICLTCDREPRCPPFGVCVRSANVPDRCVACPGYGDCELMRIADHVGMIGITIPREPIEFSPIDDNPFFEFDPNLCVECLRCVRLCKTVRGVNALGYVFKDGRPVVGTKGETFLKSGCQFCFGCVAVCPTGALVDKKEKHKLLSEMHERWKNIVPCVAACPLHIDIPGYVHAAATEDYSHALSLIEKKLPFPSLCATVCTHPCETACRRGDLDDPVAIKDIKRFIVEQTESKSEHPPPIESGKKVAVVGSGPAGLAAAYYLRKGAGHAVTIFESSHQPGGMPFSGIPRFRLPRDLLESEISKLHQLGVQIICDHPITALEPLLDGDFDAVLLTIGAHGDLPLGIDGENHSSICGAVQYLNRINSGKAFLLGNHVAVIGGGNVAIDAARTAKRMGAKEVIIVYRRSQNEMPADEQEIVHAEEEGIRFQHLTTPIRFEPLDNGIRIHCLKNKLKRPDASGRPRPKPVKGSDFHIDADSVLAAVGQYPKIPEEFDLDKNRKSCLKISEENFMTGRERVFAAGDAVHGPRTVTEAIAMGIRAANAVNRYLGGNDIIDIDTFSPSELPSELNPGDHFLNKRVAMPVLPIAERRQHFQQVELGFSKEMALKEANRCLRCSLRWEVITQKMSVEKSPSSK